MDASVIVAIYSYILGSIPFGLIFSKQLAQSTELKDKKVLIVCELEVKNSHS